MFLYIIKVMNNTHRLVKHVANNRSVFIATLNAGTDNQKQVSGTSLKQVAYNYCKDAGSFAKYNKLLNVLQSLNPVVQYGDTRAQRKLNRAFNNGAW